MAIFTFLMRQEFVYNFFYSLTGLEDGSFYPYISMIFIILVHFFFVKNINYQSVSLFKIIIFSSVALFVGIIIGGWLDFIIFQLLNQGNLSNFKSFVNTIQYKLILGCIFISSIFSTGSYYWLKNKNRWLLPLSMLLILALFSIANKHL